MTDKLNLIISSDLTKLKTAFLEVWISAWRRKSSSKTLFQEEWVLVENHLSAEVLKRFLASQSPQGLASGLRVMTLNEWVDMLMHTLGGLFPYQMENPLLSNGNPTSVWKHLRHTMSWLLMQIFVELCDPKHKTAKKIFAEERSTLRPLIARLEQLTSHEARFAFAEKIAVIFEQYLVYRTDWLRAWAYSGESNGTEDSSKNTWLGFAGDTNAKETAGWQRWLWRQFYQRYSSKTHTQTQTSLAQKSRTRSQGSQAHTETTSQMNTFNTFAHPASLAYRDLMRRLEGDEAWRRAAETKLREGLPRLFIFDLPIFAPPYLALIRELMPYMEIHYFRWDPYGTPAVRGAFQFFQSLAAPGYSAEHESPLHLENHPISLPLSQRRHEFWASLFAEPTLHGKITLRDAEELHSNATSYSSENTDLRNISLENAGTEKTSIRHRQASVGEVGTAAAPVQEKNSLLTALQQWLFAGDLFKNFSVDHSDHTGNVDHSDHTSNVDHSDPVDNIDQEDPIDQVGHGGHASKVDDGEPADKVGNGKYAGKVDDGKYADKVDPTLSSASAAAVSTFVAALETELEEPLSQVRSFEISLWANRYEEVEWVHATLAKLFREDKTLLPSDICILAPAIEDYRAILQSSFRRGGVFPLDLPPRSRTAQSLIAQRILWSRLLTMLNQSVYGVAELENFASWLLVPLQAAQTGPLPSPEEGQALWLKLLRFFLQMQDGLKGRYEEQMFSLRELIANLNAFLETPAPRYLSNPQTALIGQWMRTLRRLHRFQEDFLTKTDPLSQSLGEWQKELLSLVRDCGLHASPADGYGLERGMGIDTFFQHLFSALPALSEDRSTFEALCVPLHAFLQSQAGGKETPSLRGGIVCTSISRARSLSPRILFVLGLDAVSFPRNPTFSPFDLMAHDKRISDRMRHFRTEDEWFFLECFQKPTRGLFLSLCDHSISSSLSPSARAEAFLQCVSSPLHALLHYISGEMMRVSASAEELVLNGMRPQRSLREEQIRPMEAMLTKLMARSQAPNPGHSLASLKRRRSLRQSNPNQSRESLWGPRFHAVSTGGLVTEGLRESNKSNKSSGSIESNGSNGTVESNGVSGSIESNGSNGSVESNGLSGSIESNGSNGSVQSNELSESIESNGSNGSVQSNRSSGSNDASSSRYEGSVSSRYAAIARAALAYVSSPYAQPISTGDRENRVGKSRIVLLSRLKALLQRPLSALLEIQYSLKRESFTSTSGAFLTGEPGDPYTDALTGRRQAALQRTLLAGLDESGVHDSTHDGTLATRYEELLFREEPLMHTFEDRLMRYHEADPLNVGDEAGAEDSLRVEDPLRAEGHRLSSSHSRFASANHPTKKYVEFLLDLQQERWALFIRKDLEQFFSANLASLIRSSAQKIFSLPIPRAEVKNHAGSKSSSELESLSNDSHYTDTSFTNGNENEFSEEMIDSVLKNISATAIDAEFPRLLTAKTGDRVVIYDINVGRLSAGRYLAWLLEGLCWLSATHSHSHSHSDSDNAQNTLQDNAHSAVVETKAVLYFASKGDSAKYNALRSPLAKSELRGEKEFLKTLRQASFDLVHWTMRGTVFPLPLMLADGLKFLALVDKVPIISYEDHAACKEETDKLTQALLTMMVKDWKAVHHGSSEYAQSYFDDPSEITTFFLNDLAKWEGVLFDQEKFLSALASLPPSVKYFYNLCYELAEILVRVRPALSYVRDLSKDFSFDSPISA